MAEVPRFAAPIDPELCLDNRQFARSCYVL